MNVYSLNGVLIVVYNRSLAPIELVGIAQALKSHELPYLIFAPNAFLHGPRDA